MGLKQTQCYKYQTEQMLAPTMERSSCIATYFYRAFSQLGCQREGRTVALRYSLSLEPAQMHIARVSFLFYIKSELLLLSCTYISSYLILREVKDRKSLFCT